MHILLLDVTKDEDVTEAVKTISTALGERTLTAVFSNAGVTIDQVLDRSKPFNAAVEGVDIEAMKRLFDVINFS